MSQRDVGLNTEIFDLLCDRSSEKRQTGSEKFKNFVRTLHSQGNDKKIMDIIAYVSQHYVEAEDPQMRRGGMLALSSIVAGAGPTASKSHLDILIPAVINRGGDPDETVRKEVINALFNIVKFVGAKVIFFLPSIFLLLTKLFADRSPDVMKHAGQLNECLLSTFSLPDYDVDEFLDTFIPVLRSVLHTQNAHVRLLLIQWIENLDRVSGIDMVQYLPAFAAGLFDMLADTNQNVWGTALNRLDSFRKTVSEFSTAELLERVSLKPLVQILAEQSTARSSLQRQTALQWLGTFIDLAGPRLLPWSDIILEMIFQLLSDPVNDNVQHAYECNVKFVELVRVHVPADASEGRVTDHDIPFEMHESFSENQQSISTPVTEANGQQTNTLTVITQPNQTTKAESYPDGRETEMRPEDDTSFKFPPVLRIVNMALPSPDISTRAEALRWLSMLLQKAPSQVMRHLNLLLVSLLHNLADNADVNVLKQNLDVLAHTAWYDWDYFHQFTLEQIVALFARSRTLLENRGAFIIRRLCKLLVPEHILIALAHILRDEEHPEFAAIMVELLNLILLTAGEMREVRDVLRKTLRGTSSQTVLAPYSKIKATELHKALHDRRATGAELFCALYTTWCHNPVATFSLCLTTEAYDLAQRLICRISESHISVGLLMQIDKLVQLLESPVFVQLRMHLLQLERADHPQLIRALYGILMILPQSTAFQHLKARLTSVQALESASRVMAKSESLHTVRIDDDAFLRVFDVATKRREAFERGDENMFALAASLSQTSLNNDAKLSKEHSKKGK